MIVQMVTNIVRDLTDLVSLATANGLFINCLSILLCRLL